MKGYIVAGENILCAAYHGIPGQDDGAIAPRFAESRDFLLGDDARCVDLVCDRRKSTRVNQDRIKLRVGCA